MIPRRRLPPPPPDETDTPADASPDVHEATDVDVYFLHGQTLALTIIDADATFTELSDRYLYRRATETVEILKTAIAYVSTRHRTFETPAEPYDPRKAAPQPVQRPEAA